MFYQEVKDLKLHWDMFCGAIERWRKNDEGVTTLELVIIGAFLIAAAGALTVLFANVFNNNAQNIKNPPAVTASTGF